MYRIEGGKSILEILEKTKAQAEKRKHKNWYIWVEDLSTGYIYKLQNVSEGDLRQKSYSRQFLEDKGTILTWDIGAVSEFSNQLILLPNHDKNVWRLLHNYYTGESHKWLVPKEAII